MLGPLNFAWNQFQIISNKNDDDVNNNDDDNNNDNGKKMPMELQTLGLVKLQILHGTRSRLYLIENDDDDNNNDDHHHHYSRNSVNF